MTRWNFLKMSTSFLLAALIGQFTLAQNKTGQKSNQKNPSKSPTKISHERNKPRPNVLFLMADDFNHWIGNIGYYPHVQTPNIDALARRGVLFTDAHCSSPVCNPSRNALWSGIRPSTSEIDTNADGFIRDKKGFENIVSLHQYFKENGYHTLGAGKLWHPGRMNPKDRRVDPTNWDELYNYPTGSAGGKLYKFQLKTKKNYGWSANPDPLSPSNSNDYKMAQFIAKYIQDYDKDKPFFIGCGFFRPHMPWNSPIQFWDQFTREKLTKPAGCNEKVDGLGNDIHQEIVLNEKWKEAIHAYLASCALSDHNVGVVLKALEKTEHKDNTIIVFCGDHGWHLGEKGRWGKFALWDQANHTTLIIYDPAAKGNGTLCKKVVSLQDLYPTLVELCGLPYKYDIEGRTLKALLDNPERADWDYPVLMKYAGINYIKTNKWRFIDGKINTDKHLYDISKDPYEWNDLFDNPEYKNTVTMLRDQIKDLIILGKNLRQGKAKNEAVDSRTFIK